MNEDMSCLDPVDAEVPDLLREETMKILWKRNRVRERLNDMYMKCMEDRSLLDPKSKFCYDLSWFSFAIDKAAASMIQKLLRGVGLNCAFKAFLAQGLIDFFNTALTCGLPIAEKYALSDLMSDARSRLILKKAFPERYP